MTIDGVLMFRNVKSTAVAAMLCAVTGAALAGCDEGSESEAEAPKSSANAEAGKEASSGAEKITVEGNSVNVSCSGEAAEDQPVVVLLPGLGDDVSKMADLQQTLSEKTKVCSYDRLGQGESDQPEDVQTLDSVDKLLTGVLDNVAEDRPVVLAGHSLGGLLAAQYAPAHTDRVVGLVLMDATPPSTLDDTKEAIPESASGPAAELRAQTIAMYSGENPEMLSLEGAKVGSAGDMPVEVIEHGQPYLAELPEYGELLEKAWGEGQRKWLELSENSNLTTASESGHHIYVDQPDVVVEAVERVLAEAGK